MPRKRAKFKMETDKSRALKKVRIASGLSLIKAGKKTGISSTVINHMENGWCDVTDSHIRRFVEGLGYKLSDWDMFLSGEKTFHEKRNECFEILRKIDPNKLDVIYTMLQSFSG